MKIYTGSGDQGITSLFSGERVVKCHPRIQANGEVDELNSYLGVLAALVAGKSSELAQEILQIQSDLLHMGAWIATTADSSSADLLEDIRPERSEELERSIDRMEEALPALSSFILPGGQLLAGWAHVARAVCRRAERDLVCLPREASEGKGGEQLARALVYLNRLSDYLFVVARYCNWLEHVPDVPWKK
jgi:cob(I)alamin adenosyltransferase